jgi:hypothetical protein
LGLYARWPWINLAIGLALLALAALNWRDVAHHPRWLFFLWLALPAMFVHQFEEYVLPGGFHRWLNQCVFGSGNPHFPLTRRFACMVNLTVPVVLFPLLAWAGTDRPWIGMIGLYLLAVNAFGHLILTVSRRRYSPGVVTGVVLFLPLAGLATYAFSMNGVVDSRDLLIAALLAGLGHVPMLIYPRLRARLHPELLQPPSSA